MRCLTARRITATSLFVLLAALVHGCASESEGYEIWFGSGRTGSGDVYRLRTSPRARVAAVQHPKPDFNPRWDAARLRVVFLRETETGIEMRAVDATGEHRLGPSPADEEAPEWAPDGSAYVYATKRNNNRDLFLVDIQSDRTTRLTHHSAPDLQPAWSPDSQWIAFTSERTGNPDIWLIRRDGEDVQNLTKSESREGHPSWAPNGNQILFDCDATTDGDPDIFLFDLRRRTSTNLTRSPGVDLIARFSPDGARIAFGSSRSGDWEIYWMTHDGNDVERLTRSKGFDGDPLMVPMGLTEDLPPR